MAKKRTKAKPKPKPRITSVSQWVSARISIGLVQRLDRYAELESERTGYPISRSKALEKLLKEGLDRHGGAPESESPPPSPPARSRKRPKGSRCPKCGTTTQTAIKGRIGSDDTEEVCAECGTPRA